MKSILDPDNGLCCLGKGVWRGQIRSRTQDLLYKRLYKSFLHLSNTTWICIATNEAVVLRKKHTCLSGRECLKAGSTTIGTAVETICNTSFIHDIIFCIGLRSGWSQPRPLLRDTTSSITEPAWYFSYDSSTRDGQLPFQRTPHTGTQLSMSLPDNPVLQKCMSSLNTILCKALLTRGSCAVPKRPFEVQD